MNWVCIVFPQLALDEVLRHRSDRETPLVLVSGAGSRARVRAANASACERGVRIEQSLTTANALCPRLAVVQYDESAVECCHQLLAACAYRYSSQISRQFAGALLLEAQASFRLFGGWAALQARLREEFSALGFQHRIALAPNPCAALTLAGTRDVCTIKDDGQLRDVLDALPVECSGLDETCVASLRRMGLRRLRQVLRMPRGELGKRIGAQALLHLDRLRGLEDTPLVCYRPPDVFDRRIELPFNTASSEPLLFPLRRLLRDFTAFLARRDSGAQRFILMFDHECGASTEIRIGLLSPERDPEMLFAIARERLDRTRLPAPVCGLRLCANELPAFTPLRRSLFDPGPEQAISWESLRERLRARLGEHAVHGVALHPDHRPERAWRPFEGAPPRIREETLPPRPAWLLSRPIPLRDRVSRVIAGPERIESGWWDGADVRRDYYVIETAAHQCAWVFRPAGDDGPFMLHGWFA